ncbi:Polysaccharide deacetylase [groundwater metagenome]|uniref:Polysaccharide deacetylase n=1 Tax=groundwater metagenome TaxID=717931 RepID=A0A098EE42_9ZZZZ
MNKNFIAVTIDIEDWYHIHSVTGSPFSKFRDVDEFFSKWNKRYDYLTKPTKKVLKILDKLNIHATFFVVADVVEHYPGLVEEIADKGHEIGCHGLHHACKIHPKTKKPLMSKEEFGERTLKAKRILEKASGKKVIGYRSPNAFIGGWMLDSLEKLGFKYDSSVSKNSLYNKTDSQLINVTTAPYHPKKDCLDTETDDSKNDGLLEIPWSYFDFMGFKFPTAGGPMLRFLGSGYIVLGLKQSLKRGSTVFYFHPIDISNEKFPDIGKGRPLYWIIKGETIENRIKYILKNTPASFGCCCEILQT